MIQHFSTKILPRLMKQRTALQEMYPNDEVQIIDCMNVKHFVINAGGWFRFYKNKETEWKYLRS